MKAFAGLAAGVVLAGMGIGLRQAGWHESGMAVFGAAAGFLAQSVWSALCLTGNRLLAATRLESPATAVGTRDTAGDGMESDKWEVTARLALDSNGVPVLGWVEEAVR